MESFDALTHGDRLRYTGPDEFDGDAVAPSDWKQPYAFRYVSMHGTLACHTKFNGLKNLAPDHPANDPTFWEVVDA
jgi:hypothetical protein